MSFLWYVYHSSRGTPNWEVAVVLLGTITWNKIVYFIQTNVINKQTEA